MYPSRRRLSLSRAIDQQPEDQSGVQEKRCRFLGAMRITEILALFMVLVPVSLVIVAMFGYDQGNGFVQASRFIPMEPNVTSSSDDSTLQRDQEQKGKLTFFFLF